MTYVLIAFLNITSSAETSFAIDFKTKEVCEQFIDVFKKDIRSPRHAVLTCYPKGE